MLESFIGYTCRMV